MWQLIIGGILLAGGLLNLAWFGFWALLSGIGVLLSNAAPSRIEERHAKGNRATFRGLLEKLATAGVIAAVGGVLVYFGTRPPPEIRVFNASRQPAQVELDSTKYTIDPGARWLSAEPGSLDIKIAGYETTLRPPSREDGVVILDVTADAAYAVMRVDGSSPELIHVAPPNHVTVLDYPATEVRFVTGKPKSPPDRAFAIVRIKKTAADDPQLASKLAMLFATN